jgi:hypothetical protein
MNFNIFKILQLVVAIIEDTEIKNNPTFQIAANVIKSVDVKEIPNQPEQK